MKSYLFHLLFILFIGQICFCSLQPHISSSLIDFNRQWARFKLGIVGGTQPYKYSYDQYPLGWNPVFNYIYIPNTKLSNNKRFLFKIRIRDSTGLNWSGSVILQYKDDQFKIYDEIFDYDEKIPQSFFISDGFTGKPEAVINQLSIQEFRQTYNPVSSYSSISKQSNSTQNLEILQNVSSQAKNDSSEKIQSSENKLIGKQTSLIDFIRKNSLGQTSYYQTSFSYGSFSKTFFSLEPSAPPSLQGSFSPTDSTQAQFSSSNNLNQISPLSQQNSIQNEVSTLSIPIDKIFLRLPTQEQLDQIILTGDSFALLKTTQNVIRSDLNCSDKVYYLQDFLGRVLSAAYMKKFTAAQLQTIIEYANQVINRLQAEIKDNEQKKLKLSISSLQQKLQSELQKLQKSYNLFNDIQLKIEPLKAKIVGYELNIPLIRNKTNNYRKLIEEQQLKIISTNSDIQKLQSALMNAKNKRQSMETNIIKLQQLVSASQSQLEQNYVSISQTQSTIDQLQQESDSIKIQSKTLQIIVERIQKDVLVAKSKQDTLKARIVQIQDQIRLQKLKLAEEELYKLKNTVELLERAAPSIQQQIDRYNYECLHIAIQGNLNESSIIIYIVGQKDYTNYISNIYGNVPIKVSQIKTSLQLSTLSILSPLWVSTFGNPFTHQQMLNQNQFSFDGDFNCLQPSKLVSGSGIIRQIGQRQIFAEVTINNQIFQVKIKLGACSRIETTLLTPKLGQSIYWLGNKLEQRIFNAYRVTCL